jgi:hypothetical protein
MTEQAHASFLAGIGAVSRFRKHRLTGNVSDPHLVSIGSATGELESPLG